MYYEILGSMDNMETSRDDIRSSSFIDPRYWKYTGENLHEIWDFSTEWIENPCDKFRPDVINI